MSPLLVARVPYYVKYVGGVKPQPLCAYIMRTEPFSKLLNSRNEPYSTW